MKWWFVLFKWIDVWLIKMLFLLMCGWIVFVVLMCKKVLIFSWVSFLIVIDVDDLLILVE